MRTLLLSLGLAAGAAVPGAVAADMSYGGGIKDHGGVPVPAPVPYAETFKWYLRADLGGGWTSEPGVKESGMRYGLDRLAADGPSFGMSPSWFNTDFDTFAVGGVGVGAYLTPRFRADLTVDVRTKSEIHVDGRYSYVADPVLLQPNRRVDGLVREETDARTTLALANFYWDLTERGSRFVPYIGAGVGLAVRSLDRRHRSGESIVDTNTLLQVSSNVVSGQTKAHQLAPAAMATAGVAYTLGPGMVIDLNYRYAYVGEVDFSTNIGYGRTVANQFTSSNSRVTIDDTHEHTLRAGVRWNIW